ncbi:MAG: uroporphyrinogen-III C-methyltransferase, partial [Actinobacteria bacterium]
MPRSVLRVGTRGSALALAQAENVRKAISQVVSHRNFELVPITTRGDTMSGPIPPVGGKGLFTNDIQDALATGKIDLAVHSAKDLPALPFEGIVLAAVPPREDPRDALITRHGGGLSKLQPGATVGTSSLRRTVQLLAMGRGLVPTPMRGNVDTRLRKLSAGEVQSLVLALAGLRRLGKDSRVAEVLPTTVMLPAPGQGALAVECRAGDKDMREALSKIEDPLARRAFEPRRVVQRAARRACDARREHDPAARPGGDARWGPRAARRRDGHGSGFPRRGARRTDARGRRGRDHRRRHGGISGVSPARRRGSSRTRIPARTRLVGTVYLVGAGPGDPGLITVRGLAAMRAADVVVYDRLGVSPALLDLAPRAERIFAGKSPRRHAMTQAQINRTLVAHARRGRAVVRLKGGDPFVFGRGGEEAEALALAGMPFEVVPGVTSAIAGPAAAGIPVTHRDAAASVVIATAHEAPGKAGSRLDWGSLAGADTVVLLMGVERLPEAAAALIAAGKPKSTPAAVIGSATLPSQQTVVAPLSRIATAARRAGITPPAVTVVGDVVRLREVLGGWDTRPLSGKRVLVTRTREQASELSGVLRELGAEVVEAPAIRVEPPRSCSAVDRAISHLSSRRYSWVVFTSANGVRFFFSRLRAARLDARAFGGVRAAAVGAGTADAL